MHVCVSVQVGMGMGFVVHLCEHVCEYDILPLMHCITDSRCLFFEMLYVPLYQAMNIFYRLEKF